MVWPYSTINKDSLIAIVAALILVPLGFRLFDQNHDYLVPPRTTVDLGRVSVGQTVEKPFCVLNSSSRAIEIIQWSPTCRCMQARFNQTIIAPHSEVEAYVCTTATRPLGARAAGIAIQWRYVGEQFVRTDYLFAKARYISNFVLSEERLDFGDVSNDHTLIHTLRLRHDKDGGDSVELEVTSNSKSLSATVAKEVDGYRVEAKLDPESLPSGVWRGALKIFTVLNGVRTGDEIDIPSVARIEGSVRASPSVLQLSSSLSQRQFFSLEVHSTVGSMSGLRFLGNLVEKPEVLISRDGKEATMTGFLPSPATKGAYAGKIPIQVNNDPRQTFQVSYLGFAG